MERPIQVAAIQARYWIRQLPKCNIPLGEADDPVRCTAYEGHGGRHSFELSPWTDDDIRVLLAHIRKQDELIAHHLPNMKEAV